MNLENFFEIQFDDPNINRQQLRKFTEDHLKRLATNNTANLYDQLLTDTQDAYEDYFGALNDHDTNSAVQQSRTKSMNNVLSQFIALVSKRAGLITNFFDKDSPEYQEFFPHMLTEYSRAGLENVETLMTRMVNAATKHAATVGVALSAEFAALKTAFLTARGQQLTQKTMVDQSSDSSNTTRDTLEVQLTKNLLTIALNNIGNAAAAKLFFDQSIINRPKHNDNKEATPQSEPVK